MIILSTVIYFKILLFPSPPVFHSLSEGWGRNLSYPFCDCPLCSGFVGAQQSAANEHLSVEKMNNLLSLRFKEKKKVGHLSGLPVQAESDGLQSHPDYFIILLKRKKKKIPYCWFPHTPSPSFFFFFFPTWQMYLVSCVLSWIQINIALKTCLWGELFGQILMRVLCFCSRIVDGFIDRGLNL